MNEVESVKVVRDTAHKNRWGTGLGFYRQDGKKLTVNGKYFVGAVTAIFIISSALALVFGHTQMAFRSPIVFNGIMSNVSNVDIPPAAAGTSQDERKGDNGSGSKRLAARQYSGLQMVNRPRSSQIPPGIVAKATLVTGASNGLVKAVLKESLTVNGESIADVGTVLIGTGSSTEERLLVNFTKLVFKDGTVQNIKAQACDNEDQSIGLKGSKISKYGTMLAAGVGLNFVGGLAAGLQEEQVYGGVAIKKNNLKNAALNGAAVASIEQSKEIMEKWKQQKTIIAVKQGTDICVIVEGE